MSSLPSKCSQTLTPTNENRSPVLKEGGPCPGRSKLSSECQLPLPGPSSASPSVGSELLHHSTTELSTSAATLITQVSSLNELADSHHTTSLRPSSLLDDLIQINVSGRCYILSLSRLEKCATIREIFRREAVWHPSRGEFFLERDPELFSILFRYVLYGHLHLPKHLCPQVVWEELSFWGFHYEDLKEECCHLGLKSALNEGSVLRKLNSWLYEKPPGRLANPLKKAESLAQVRKQVWKCLSEPRSSWLAYGFFLFSLALTVFTVVLLWVDSSLPSPRYNRTSQNTCPLPRTDHNLIPILLDICSWLFFIECVWRLIFCPALYPYFLNMATVNDLLLFIAVQLHHILRGTSAPSLVCFLVRFCDLCFILRLLRFLQYFFETRVLFFTICANLRKLMVICAYLLVTALVFGTVLFIMDTTNIHSLEDAVWWSVITMTTVGYGDKVPHSGAGRVVGIFCAFTGISMVALVIPIFSNNFFRYYSHAKLLREIRRSRKQRRRQKVGHMCCSTNSNVSSPRPSANSTAATTTQDWPHNSSVPTQCADLLKDAFFSTHSQ